MIDALSVRRMQYWAYKTAPGMKTEIAVDHDGEGRAALFIHGVFLRMRIYRLYVGYGVSFYPRSTRAKDRRLTKALKRAELDGVVLIDRRPGETWSASLTREARIEHGDHGPWIDLDGWPSLEDSALALTPPG